ncbi:MAG: UDP-N-acetylmuramate dehydrogenase [bacterium]|nr:UDP-N-acetylmuramate dehydrogenase [bacterium]
MHWLSEFKERVEQNVPLSPMTWFKLGGCAQHMYRPNSAEDLARLMRRAHEENVSTRVLGGGANVLIQDDGVNGVVIRMDDPGFQGIDFEGTRVVAAGGADLMRLVLECVRRSLSGLEGLAGIPGTVGGAICMNAGGKFGSIGDCVHAVQLLSLDGTVRMVSKSELDFGYRCSGVGRQIVLSAEFELVKEDSGGVRARYDEAWAAKKRSQPPLKAHSAGCVFKNPPGHSAGKLIDQAGMKGETVGGASVSAEHANFIIAHEGATSADVLRLVERIQEKVRRKFGINLEMEIDVW